MKNKFLIALIIIGLICAYPLWRYFSNANIFVKSLESQVAEIGNWTKGSVNVSLDGTINIRNVNYTPNNYEQGFEIGHIKISLDPWFLLKSNSEETAYLLPETLTVSLNGAMLNNKSDDIYQSLRKDSMWMLLVGYAGSFGCTRESYTSFDENTWKKIFSRDQAFNVDLFYSRQQDGSLDADFIIEAENQFSSTWSSNLKSIYNDNQIIIKELVVDKLFYNYLDYGFNLKRNDACKENYNSSFASYRLSSADHIQTYLRSYFSKEMPTILINWYQRMLAPDIEYNAIITLNEPKYLSSIYSINQYDLYTDSTVEVATTENNYLPITLTEIDYTTIDTEVLKRENLKRKQEEIDAKEKLRKSKLKKPLIYTTGKIKSRKIPMKNMGSAINKKIRIKTKIGRPITGFLTSVKGELLILETTYKTGRATISIKKANIASVEQLN